MRERDVVLIKRAADLRRGMTDAEVRLWSRLKGRQLANAKFSRQIAIGRYICDFVCRERRLIVELDGSQHFENEYDEDRDRRLRESGYSILRFWNAEVLESDESLEHVLRCIAVTLGDLRQRGEASLDATAHPRPLPVGEGRFRR